MTHKDFVLIAEVIRDMPSHAPTLRAQRESYARAFAAKLPSTNPNFNPSRFLAACGVE